MVLDGSVVNWRASGYLFVAGEREAGAVCVEVFPFPEDLCSRLEDEKAQAADESGMRKEKKKKGKKDFFQK